MNATLKRRLERASLDIDSVWRDSWDAWAVEVMAEWQRTDSDFVMHFAEFQGYEQEWVSNFTSGERAEFLSRGMSLCVSRGLPAELWVWFWRDVYGPALEGDLNAWPRLIPKPLELEVAQSIYAEGCLGALIAATVVAR